MRLASPQEFATAYTDYRWHEGYEKRARLLASLPEPMLIVGCGFGFLVAELLKLGRDAFGIDAADYCYEQRVVKPFMQHDILRGPFSSHATVISEDLLPWLTDKEARICAKHCALTGPLVLHLVTEQGQADYNYHSTGYWMALTNQLTISLEGM